MDTKKDAAQDVDFNFGLMELRATLEALEAMQAPPVIGPELQFKPADLGFDPYNTSGNFDLKRNWMRVGNVKRRD